MLLLTGEEKEVDGAAAMEATVVTEAMVAMEAMEEDGDAKEVAGVGRSHQNENSIARIMPRLISFNHFEKKKLCSHQLISALRL
jgi:hypothetical protein